MSTVIDSTAIRTKPLSWIALAFAVALVLAAVGMPNLMRARMAANDSSRVTQERALETKLASNMYYSRAAKARPLAMIASDASTKASKDEEVGAIVPGERKMVRTGSIDLIVQKPAEAAERIRALAEGMGGFLVSSEVSGVPLKQTASLTIRVPAASFEEARAEIRKLGLRVESEKVEAQDVTRQYVDQDANLRNLRAEETQYLSILKQAHTVKDTLAVSEKLSEVRGQIEQQQAEFEVLSNQIATVAIIVLLRAEAEEQVFGLHWRPLYQMKLALRDGLDALADYAGSMTSIVFYLPAALLWALSLAGGYCGGWRGYSSPGRGSLPCRRGETRVQTGSN